LRWQEYIGTLVFSKNLRDFFKYLAVLLVPPRAVVGGEMCGSIMGKGKVLIKDKAVFCGSISAESLIVQGVVVGNINTKKLIIRKEGQLYYNRVNQSFLKISRNGTYASIMNIKETINERDCIRAVFINKIMKQAEKFINSWGKDELEFTIEAPHIISKEIPESDNEVSGNFNITAPIQADPNYMLSNTAVTRQGYGNNCAVPKNSDILSTQDKDELQIHTEVVRKLPQGMEKPDGTGFLHTNTFMDRKELATTQPHLTTIQEGTELESQDVLLLQKETVLLKPHAEEKQKKEILSSTLRNKRQPINFINTY
jgi:hypothetical protein